MNYIVTTTINIPHFLKDLVQDTIKHGHEFQVIVIGDLKSPAGCEEFCATLPNTHYLGPLKQQHEFGHLKLYNHLPFNSVQRRNLGYLYCLQRGIEPTDTLVTMDDDNFLKNPDYIGQHLANQQLTAETVSANAPTWFNPLTKFFTEQIIPRGFSIFDRQADQQPVTTEQRTTTIAISAGLWEKNPDVDALTNLVGLPGPCLVNRTDPLVLANNILCPFNTQNTAYFAGTWLTAFLSPYVGRHDDIISSYITKRITDHLGLGISFGQPIVIQDRNPHDYHQDFRLEVHGYSQIDSFVDFLYSISLTSTSILDCYQQLADALKGQYQGQTFDAVTHQLPQPWSLAKVAQGMQLWLDTLDQLKVIIPSPATAKAASHA